MIEHKVLSKGLIEFGVDPLNDNDYADCYSTSLSREELEFLIKMLDEADSENKEGE